ncbi:hypothetical protein EIP91_005622 [Steccherinum ochraceum]|uniref:HMG box domain-containing protein n=1 Tax=Steccherinum ochraceum TaxID=92696 RepID=A0A4R0RFD8_9APHY|nr:hypothetical protein EIP91_005622 [Steccherinum ochraceum]
MPATTRYASYRRKSSLINGLTPVKPGNYGIPSPRPSPKAVIFAPNVTPGTFTEPEPVIDEDSPLPPSPSDALFPPSLNPDANQSRRRVPPGKRRSQGYIPRPPNAFMLFRADFVRQKHVPGSIETNHSSLSKIIGNCWKALPPEEKKPWDTLAKQAKAKHQKLYPDYRFRPVHNKAKKQAREAAKNKALPTPQDEQRCEDVAAMLLEGKKGDELAAAVRDYDITRGMTSSPMMHAPVPNHAQLFEPLHTYDASAMAPSYQFARRPSSVPLPGISLPSLPMWLPTPQTMMEGSLSRPESPMSHYDARSQYFVSRRPSSAAPIMGRSWDMPVSFYADGPSPDQLQQDNEPLPDVNAGIFEQSFFDASGFSFGGPSAQVPDMSTAYGAPNVQQPDLALSISPLDSMVSEDMTSASTITSAGFSYPTPSDSSYPTPGDSSYPTPNDSFYLSDMYSTLDPSSGPSSAFSGSPAPSEASLPMHQQQQQQVAVVAPQPQHPANGGFDAWDHQQSQQQIAVDHQMGLSLEYPMDPTSQSLDCVDPVTYGMDLYGCGAEAGPDAYPYHQHHPHHPHDDMMQSLDVIAQY